MRISSKSKIKDCTKLSIYQTIINIYVICCHKYSSLFQYGQVFQPPCLAVTVIYGFFSFTFRDTR